MNILTVTAHPDDEILGFGGASWVYTQRGHKVTHCILSGKVEARRVRPDLEELRSNCEAASALLGCEDPILGDFPNIRFNTVPHLELVQFIESVVENVLPDLIFTHHPADLNDDHYHVSRACQAASRLYQRKELKRIHGLYYMEIPSSTDWSYAGNGNGFNADTFLEIGEEGLEKKVAALTCYRGVMRSFPHPRSKEILQGLAAYRGGQSGTRYAEAFQTAFHLL